MTGETIRLIQSDFQAAVDGLTRRGARGPAGALAQIGALREEVERAASEFGLTTAQASEFFALIADARNASGFAEIHASVVKLREFLEQSTGGVENMTDAAADFLHSMLEAEQQTRLLNAAMLESGDTAEQLQEAAASISFASALARGPGVDR